MIFGIFIIISLITIMILIYNFIYNKKMRIFWKTFIEIGNYINKIEHNRTKFFKRLGNQVYIEYGIDRYLIITLCDDIFKSRFKFKDDKTYNVIHSYNSRYLSLFNLVVLKNTFNKHKDEIFNVVEYGDTLVDEKTFKLMETMIELTKESIMLEQNINNPSDIVELDIDDILDKINKVGYNELSDEEKDFLRKQK